MPLRPSIGTGPAPVPSRTSSVVPARNAAGAVSARAGDDPRTGRAAESAAADRRTVRRPGAPGPEGGFRFIGVSLSGEGVVEGVAVEAGGEGGGVAGVEADHGVGASVGGVGFGGSGEA